MPANGRWDLIRSLKVNRYLLSLRQTVNNYSGQTIHWSVPISSSYIMQKCRRKLKTVLRTPPHHATYGAILTGYSELWNRTWKLSLRCIWYTRPFIHSFIFRKYFTRYGNNHFYNSTKKKTAAWRIYIIL